MICSQKEDVAVQEYRQKTMQADDEDNKETFGRFMTDFNCHSYIFCFGLKFLYSLALVLSSSIGIILYKVVKY